MKMLSLGFLKPVNAEIDSIGIRNLQPIEEHIRYLTEGGDPVFFLGLRADYSYDLQFNATKNRLNMFRIYARENNLIETLL